METTRKWSVSELCMDARISPDSAAAGATVEVLANRLTGRCARGPPASWCGSEAASPRFCARSGDPDAGATREAGRARRLVAAGARALAAWVGERDGAARAGDGVVGSQAGGDA